jgi:hypothetical protein
MQFQLKGLPAVAVIVLVLGFSAYRVHSMQTALDTDGANELKFWISSEYASQIVQSLPEDVGTMSEQEETEAAKRLLALERIEFTSIHAKGIWGKGKDSDVVVKVDILVDGQPPPDGVTTRYYDMRYSSMSGWRVIRRTSAWSYRLKLF